ncbi:MAG: hypothetical protein CSA65_01760 [Proteobacteria bacterium]|nr:MAG: hypothetical protein CSB49_05960 [Pseudomonadota bacterium]PIE19621.1 MAG: hypothetical protein CSA65_01760 [Pseudomonadota bacterium]
MKCPRYRLPIALGILLSACGGEGTPYTPNPDSGGVLPKWENKTPALYVASPSELAVGDEMTILGKDFIDGVHGSMTVRFLGTFFDDQGNNHAVDYTTNANPSNTTKVRWRLFPNVVFHPQGDRLGRFVGQLTVTNTGFDGSQTTSTGLPVTIDIKPSIIPRIVRPTNVACGNAVITDTREGQPMAFTAEVIGLREGTADTPLTFHWTFMFEHWDVAFSHGSFDPSSVIPKSGAMLITDEVTQGRASVVQDGGTKNMLLKIGEDLLGTTRLKSLKTKQIPPGGNNMPISVNVAVVDSAGKSARLSLTLTIHRMADMIYNENDRIAQRYQPVQVTDCIPGGNIGRDSSYHETQSESRARSMGFNYNAQVGVTMGLPSNPFALGVNFSAGFGVNINETLSTDKSQSLNLSGHILPGMYGVFYRQTTKIERIARLVGWTACGESVDLGEAILTDWIFTPDLATGPTCVPPSNLPAAQIFDT